MFDDIIECHKKTVVTPDEAIRIVQRLYSTLSGQELLEACKDQTEHNYNLLLEMANVFKK